MLVRDTIYINGAWVPSTGTGTLDVIDSTTEEVFATIPEGTPEDVDKAVEAAAAAFPGWAATSTEERAKLLTRIGEALAARTDEIAAGDLPRGGHADDAVGHRPGRPARGRLRRRRQRRRGLPVGRGDRQLARGPRARRCRGRHHAVELPPVPDRAQGGTCAGCGLHRRAQAERGGADQRLHPGRDHRRGRTADRRLQLGHRRRAGGRRGDRCPPQGRHGVLHRLDPGRTSGSWSSRARASSGSRSRWAASRPTSCSRTPTWRRRCRPGCSAAT